MKNILLIITLFISWNAIAVEKTWFCVTEKSGGLQYKDDTWKAVVFKDERMTVKQNDIDLSFSKNSLESYMNKCEEIFSNTMDLIQCTGPSKMFLLNTKTGLATSSSIWGWSSDEGESGTLDSLSVDLWKCESF